MKTRGKKNIANLNDSLCYQLILKPEGLFGKKKKIYHTEIFKRVNKAVSLKLEEKKNKKK